MCTPDGMTPWRSAVDKVSPDEIPHLHTASGYAKGGVLDALMFLDEGGGAVGEPDSGGVEKEGGDEGFVCEDKGLIAQS